MKSIKKQNDNSMHTKRASAQTVFRMELCVSQALLNDQRTCQCAVQVMMLQKKEKLQKLFSIHRFLWATGISEIILLLRYFSG